MNNKFIKDTTGMTLIELLGTIAILGIMSALMFPILISGMKSANDIQKETMLRDEADYLIASLVKELYTTRETEIKKKNLPERGRNDYYVTKINGLTEEKTGFINNTLEVAGKEITQKNSSIKLLPSKIIELEEGRYEVILALEYNGRNSKAIEFKNVIQTINDKTIEKGEKDS